MKKYFVHCHMRLQTLNVVIKPKTLFVKIDLTWHNIFSIFIDDIHQGELLSLNAQQLLIQLKNVTVYCPDVLIWGHADILKIHLYHSIACFNMHCKLFTNKAKKNVFFHKVSLYSEGIVTPDSASSFPKPSSSSVPDTRNIPPYMTHSRSQSESFGKHAFNCLFVIVQERAFYLVCYKSVIYNSILSHSFVDIQEKNNYMLIINYVFSNSNMICYTFMQIIKWIWLV